MWIKLNRGLYENFTFNTNKMKILNEKEFEEALDKLDDF